MKLNRYIDHTLLKPTATKKDIIKLCEEAKEYQFFSVCVNSCYVKLAKKELNKSDVAVCSVIGFPLGAMNTKAKVSEAKKALKDGATEIDMVLNIGLLKSFDFKAVQKDIEAVKKIMGKKILKVILETCLLTDQEITKASEIALKAKSDFIKTSTGFSTDGATEKAIELMKIVASKKMKIKASGGIRDAKTVKKYINLGVSRIGTSSGIAIVGNTVAKKETY